MLNHTEARSRFLADKPFAEDRGVIFEGATSYLPDEFRRNYQLAMDAQPGLSTDPNSAVPAMLTTYIDPDIYEILFTPNMGVEILGENRKGDWTTDTAMFPVVEHDGEVSSYSDYVNNGRAGANTNWPNYQSYLWQIILNYGDRELARAGLARINWVSELQRAAATVMDKFSNFTYHYGVTGLQNYGFFNDPALSAPLTPATKAAGGTTWFVNGAPNATANEVYNDIVSVFESLVIANNGNVDKRTKMTLHMSPGSEVALTFTNSFGVNVEDLLKKNFPNLRVLSDPLDAAFSSSNPQGFVGGNFMQLIADEVQGQDTGYCAFNEKMRSHPIVRELSSFKQKITGGSWGAVIRYPAGFASMLGI